MLKMEQLLELHTDLNANLKKIFTFDVVDLTGKIPFLIKFQEFTQ